MDPKQNQNESPMPEKAAAENASAEQPGGTPPLKKQYKKALWIGLSAGLVGLLLLGALFLPRLLSPSLPESEGDKPESTKEPEPEKVIGDDEIRGVYIASVFNINFPSKKGLGAADLASELDEIVTTSRATGFDTIYFQVRPSADALYDSKIFPTSRYLTGEEGAPLPMDPLAYLIEKAAQYDMKVVAWVNPYRVTASAADSKEEALATLSPEHPARLDPSLTVFYGGKLYFNPAREKVRDLIVGGVQEIVEQYDVAGILYDDYFYPYPVSGEEFDDEEMYVSSESPLSHEDWRREQVNLMVEASFRTIKAKSQELTFGVSPFGIWKNAGSDPAGSDTRGLEAYHSLYCDALAWIRGGYIDYISPQLYWERGFDIADFATLVRWWSAQVDGTGVGLVVSHAAYRVKDFKLGGEEIAQQVQYARSFMGSCGSIQYGYADIQKNTAGVKDALTRLFSDAYMEDEGVAVEGLSFSYPSNGVKTTNSTQFVSVRSDPAYPVYQNGVKLGRTKNGFLSLRMPLALGSNTLTLTQNGKDYTLSVVRTESSSSPSRLKKLAITEFSPEKEGVIASSGASLPLKVVAPARGRVTATLNDQVVELVPTIEPADTSPYAREVYEGQLPIPVLTADAPASMGAIRFTFTSGTTRSEVTGPDVSVVPAGQTLSATVTKDYSHIKVEPDSSFYDDFTPASVGMRAKVDAVFDSYCLLSFGAYVAQDCVSLSYDPVPNAILTGVKERGDDKNHSFDFAFGAAPAVNVEVDGAQVRLTFFDAGTTLTGAMKLQEDQVLFSAGKLYEEAGRVICDLSLRNSSIYFGCNASYADGVVTVSFRMPQTLAPGDQPLKGKVIALDAGHGGSDPGAAGFLPGNQEKDLNLAIALALREELCALGAEVHMIRTEDQTASLTERMDFLTALSPDLSLSVHHNSTNEASDANDSRGTLGLYWAPSGVLLAQKVQESVQSALCIQDLGHRAQMLALCRNHRFPQALIETSFICNPAEYEMAMRSDYTAICAGAMRDGILSWFSAQEEALGGAGK